jgi:hypothetical protein
VRYVDDFALLHDDPAVLAQWRGRIARYLEGRRLRLHPRKTVILPTAEPAAFLGFVVLPGGGRRLPEDNVARFRNRLRGVRDRWRAGAVTRAEVEAKVGAWIAPCGERGYVAAATGGVRGRVVRGGGPAVRWRDAPVFQVWPSGEFPILIGSIESVR